MSPYDVLLPTYRQMLRALDAWLVKAGDPPLDARLAPDILPLAAQVRVACFQAQEPMWRLRGEAPPEALVAVRGEAWSDPAALGLDAARARIAEALAFLDAVDTDAAIVERVALDLPNGMTLDFTPAQYVVDWALPQFYFHIDMAYALLRANGADLGKIDYAAHALPRLRT